MFGRWHEMHARHGFHGMHAAMIFGPVLHHLAETCHSPYERLSMEVLEALQDQRRTGAEVIKALEAKLPPWLAPEPERIYPLLQLLQDRDQVLAQQEEGRILYALTEAGRKALAERRADPEEAGLLTSLLGEELSGEMHQIHGQLKEIFGVLRRRAMGHALAPEQARAIAKILQHALEEIRGAVG